MTPENREPGTGNREPVRPKRPTIVLKLPCPRCKGALEKQILDKPQLEAGQKPKVRCIACKVKWPDYVSVFKETQKANGLSLDKVRGVLVKGKAYVRGARNVVERVRASQVKLRRAAQAIRHLKEDGAATEVGSSLEGIVSQMINSLDDVKTAITGEVAPFIGEKDDEAQPEPEQEHGDPEND